MKKLAAGLVALQLVLLAALLLEPRGSFWSLGSLTLIAATALATAGLILAISGVAGLGSALTASPIPRISATLVTHGVYSVIRNPIYSALMLGGLGLVIFGAS